MPRIKIQKIQLWIILLYLLSGTAVSASPAPAFSLPGQNADISLDDYKGSIVYLDFWASWCAPCRKSLPWMDTIQARYKDQGLTVIAINLDESREAAEAFLNSMNITLKVAFDDQGTTAEAFNLVAMPTSYLIDKNGQIVQTHLGFRLRDKAVIEQSIQQLLESS